MMFAPSQASTCRQLHPSPLGNSISALRPSRTIAAAAPNRVQSPTASDAIPSKTLGKSKQRATKEKAATNVNGSKDQLVAERRASNSKASTSARKSSSSRTEDVHQDQLDGEDEQQPTELIFRLERRGEGWGEEIIPHLTVEQRPINPPAKSKKVQDGADPNQWEPTGLEAFLVECGVPIDDIELLVTTVVAWRFTPAGRPLIDRRRLSRIERNVRMVAAYLEMECSIPFGPKGVAAVFAKVPELMLCKPAANDRWDRRAVELAAYLHTYSHCNVPEDWEPNPELGLWVKRQRVSRAGGQLSEERLVILERMGFEFGDLAQVTEEWEHRFDQLIDWVLWHRENHQKFCWVGIDWGERGGVTARELALWMALQKEFRRRQLLPVEALKRFEAISVVWDAPLSKSSDAQWMEWFGRLLYVVERQTTGMRRSPSPAIKQTRGRTPADSSNDDGDDHDHDAPTTAVNDVRRRTPPADQQAKARLARVVADRRAALKTLDLRSEPGLRVWLARQQWMWRHQRLPQEQVRMLHMAGFSMDKYTPGEWQYAAHAAAAMLQGSKITLFSAAATKPTTTPPSSGSAATTKGTGKRGRSKASSKGPAVTSSVAASIDEGDAEHINDTHHEQQLQHASTTTTTPKPVHGNGSYKLWVKRWVQTQQALFAEGRLSRAQLRYLSFLGITWILADEVVLMNEDDWGVRCETLYTIIRNIISATSTSTSDSKKTNNKKQPSITEHLPPGLKEWLAHQRGLHALGLLSPHRVIQLSRIPAVGWKLERTPEEDAWDTWLSKVLAFKAENGTLDGIIIKDYDPKMYAWLKKLPKDLPRCKAAQLQAIGLDVAAVVDEAKTAAVSV